MKFLVFSILTNELQELNIVDGGEIVVQKLFDAVLIIDHCDAIHGDKDASLLE